VSPGVIGRDLLDALGASVPGDHSRQASAEQYARALRPATVMDLGCGTGDSVDIFRALDPAVRWLGVDIAGSPEVLARRRADAEFLTFDGVNLPVADAGFELVYCKQVLEHVRDPAPLLAEVARVLRPGGHFAGSTSQLEPFHSFSTWNYTPYGFAVLVERAGLELVEVRPSIDAAALVLRRALHTPRWTSRWWEGESPLNRVLGLAGRASRADPASVNAAKLVFCGQFTFLARRPGP
jgi:SAM-dependent methyltransferase